ncbi:MAG: DUF3618 domain-containing protein [Saccharothrix sp.]|nr:DUF3618 domain-containing protein [Saccharothrix sp.]
MSKDNPQNPAELRADIERTRGDLGDTVEALVHKVDVPARVKETAHEKVEQVKDTAQQGAVQVKEQAATVAERVNTAAAVAAEKAQEAASKVTVQASQVTDRAVQALPQPVAEQVRRHPAALALGAVAAVLVLWRLTRGRS